MALTYLQRNKKFGKIFILGVVVVVVVIVIYMIYKYMMKSSSNIIKCNMKYGLCPAARCVPDPYDDSKAVCMCDVVTGPNYSVGIDDCEKIKPYMSNSGQEVIFSDFSPIIEKMGYHLQKCHPEEVNLNCMNKICSVDPNDPSKAICLCDKLDNKGLEWVTYNKDGGPRACNYQSGASTQGYVSLKSFIESDSMK